MIHMVCVCRKHVKGVFVRPGVLEIACLAFLFAGCNRKAGLPKVRLRVNGSPLEVEVAHKREQRALGYRFRERVPEGTGMIFLFPERRYAAFVMSNTSCPLSIAFLRKDGVITQIEHMDPLDKTPVRSVSRVRLALEVPRGWFGRNGVKEGSKVEGVSELVKRFPPE